MRLSSWLWFPLVFRCTCLLVTNTETFLSKAPKECCSSLPFLLTVSG